MRPSVLQRPPVSRRLAAVMLLPLVGMVAVSGPSGTAAPAGQTPVRPVTQNVTATEDAWTTPWSPVGPSGSNNQVLMVGDELLDGRVSYLKFAVPALPTNATNISAALQLHQVAPSVVGSITVYRVVDPWAASTLAPEHGPGLAGPLGYADVAAVGSVTSVALPPSRVPWGGEASYGITAGQGGALAIGFASTAQPNPTLAPQLAITYDIGSTPTCSVSSLLVPSCGAWFGSTVNPRGTETGPQDALVRLETELGRKLDIVHVYHSGTEDWPTAAELALTSDPTVPRLLMVNWKPENGSTWAQVAAGAQDPWIDTVATRIVSRLGASRFFLTIHHEPENEVLGAGSGYAASDFVAMFRHVVQRLRADGVTSALFVWDVMGFSNWGDQGYYDALYPGDDVVDWIGYDPYSRLGASLTLFANRPGQTFPGFYTWATTTHTDKPLMLAEFGVGSPVPADRVAVLSSLAAQAPTMPAIKAFVYFDHGLDSTTNGNDWSFESDLGVLQAAHSAFLSPYFMQH